MKYDDYNSGGQMKLIIKLYLTDMIAANDEGLIQLHDIKGIISLGGLEEKVYYHTREEVVYLHVYIDDRESECILISRSSTIVIAYLMKRRDMSFSQACQLVQSKRSFISPNAAFLKQLNRLEEQF